MKRYFAYIFIMLMILMSSAKSNVPFAGLFNSDYWPANLNNATGILIIANGGTNATTAATALTNLLSGSVIPVANGGTDFTTLADTTRAPSQADDTTRVFSVGQFWKDQNLNLWTNIVNTTGVAIWNIATNTIPYPCDALGGCYSAYGVIQLVKAYTGAAFQITRASDSTTLDLPFINRVADWQSGDIFCSGTTCTITKIYNQTSTGSTHDCAPSAAGAAAPYPTQTFLGMRALNMNGNYRQQQNSSFGAECTDGNASFNNNAMSMFYAGRHQQIGNIQMDVQLGGSGAYAMRWFFGNGSDAFVTTGGTLNPLSPQGSRGTSPTVWGFTSGASSVVSYGDDKSTTNGGHFTSATWTNLTLGSDPSAESSHYFSAVDWWAFLTFNSQLSSTNVGILKQILYTLLPIQPQLRTQLVNVGDSLSASWGDSVGATWSTQLANMIPRQYKLNNQGLGGTTCQALSTSTYYTVAMAQGVTMASTVFCGTNDIENSVSAATTYGYLQTVVGNMCTQSPAAPVLVLTMIDRQNGNKESVRQSYNTLIRNGITAGTLASCKTILVDVGGAAPLGVSGNSTNTVYFQTDQIHLTDTGYNVIAQYVYAVMSSNQLWK